jgi:hypothetical protein
LLVDGIHTLTNVIIVNPIRAYLVLWATLSYGVVVLMAAHVKEGLYHIVTQHTFFFFMP